MVRSAIKKIAPRSIKRLYHWYKEWRAAQRYSNPSRELYVIGVTGTSGKSTTVLLLRHLLEQAGFVVGSLSTVDFSIAGESQLNDKKMTMLGHGETQRWLREMVTAGCDIAIVETTSEGTLQFRNRHIYYDQFVVTNLYPEHIQSHGSFENYKEAKRGMIRRMVDIGQVLLPASHPLRVVQEEFGQPVLVSANNEHMPDFLTLGTETHVLFGSVDEEISLPPPDVQIQETVLCQDIEMNREGLSFTLFGERISTPLFGRHNVWNLMAAVAVAQLLGVKKDVMDRFFEEPPQIPGRIERIPEANTYGVTVIVDYAFEPVALRGLYDVVHLMEPTRVIHVLGGTGGGRDAARRAPMGKIAGTEAAIVIVTNEDPYDEDPRAIMEMVAAGAREAGKKDGEDLFIIDDRGDAITKAIDLAQQGDLVLVTGKGSEQAIAGPDGVLQPWDDRQAVRAALSRRA